MTSKHTSQLKMRYKGSAEPWTPDVQQKRAVKYLLEHAAAGLLLDPGFGKTAVTLAAFSFLKEQGVAERMLILAPARVMNLVWPAEVEKWRDFHHLKIVVLHGPDKERLLEESMDADICVTNFESLPWLMNIETTPHKSGRGKSVKVDKRRFRKLKFDTLVVDELSKFKWHTSVRFKTLKEVVYMFSRRWGLTGSPAANGLRGLFGQCYILDDGRTFGKYHGKFVKKYFDTDPYSYALELKDGAEDQIYEAIAPLMLRIDETEMNVSLPKIVPRTIFAELPSKARRIYTELENTLITEVDGKVVTAANAATASMKCRQITAGAVYVEADIEDMLKKHKISHAPTKTREAVHIHDAKLEALQGFLDELEGKPVLIAYDFQHDLERISRLKGPDGKPRYPDGVPYIGGGTTPKKAAELEAAWLAGEISELYGHPQSIAHGLNLQFWGKDYPRHVLWFSLTWDYELYDQFIRRVRRRGNKAARVFVHHILAKDTIDEYILGVLFAKRRAQNALFEALKMLRDARSSKK